MNRRNRIWIVDGPHLLQRTLAKWFAESRTELKGFATTADLFEAFKRDRPDVLLLDGEDPPGRLQRQLERIHELAPGLPTVVTVEADLHSTVAAFAAGAFDCLPYPFRSSDAIEMLTKACEHGRRRGLRASTQPSLSQESDTELLGRSAAMRELFRVIARVAASDITLLLIGESGTGKELVARAIHQHSSRAGAPFVVADLSNLSEDAIEEELFGVARTANNPVRHEGPAYVDQASGGTLFLNSVERLPVESRRRLIRLLSQPDSFSTGTRDKHSSGLRLIVGTQPAFFGSGAGPLDQAWLRRLDVMPVAIPSLRERRDDIPLLVHHFLREAADEFRLAPKLLSVRALEALRDLEWPGNLRQLSNLCRWLTAMAPGMEIEFEDLPADLFSSRVNAIEEPADAWEARLESWVNECLSRGETDLAQTTFDLAEGVLIKAALRHTGGRRQEAARLLGFGRNTLARKLKERASVDNG